MSVLLRPTSIARVAGQQRESLTATVRDLGSGDLPVRSDQRLIPGNVLELSFGQPRSGLDLRARVDVRRVAHVRSVPVDVWEAGCEFRDGSPEVRAGLLALIADQQRLTAPPPTTPALKAA